MVGACTVFQGNSVWLGHRPVWKLAFVGLFDVYSQPAIPKEPFLLLPSGHQSGEPARASFFTGLLCRISRFTNRLESRRSLKLYGVGGAEIDVCQDPAAEIVTSQIKIWDKTDLIDGTAVDILSYQC